ncbi:MAG: dTDP-4-amino-4,6-dideoxygalactose transaminase [Thermoanaerobaculia bacterium]
MIEFNKPILVGREREYMAEALAGGHISACGPFTRRCEARLQESLGAPRVILTTSGTDALEMAALMLDLRPDDEVLLPSFTFVSTANAFALRGARPVFVDIRPDTLTMDPAHAEALAGPRTRALVPVHYSGVGCDMDALLGLAERAGADVIEDNAHGLFNNCRGRQLGTLGRFGILSFHETKNLTCGEGGALIVNRKDDVSRSEVLRDKGTDRSRFLQGLVDKYTWVDAGSSFGLSDLLAAFLFAQLEVEADIQERRRAIWMQYRDGLAGWARAAGVELPTVPADCNPSWHSFFLLLPPRDAMIRHLRERGIDAVFHYQPLHLSPMGLRFGGRSGDCPVTERVSDRLVRLPFHNGLSRDDVDRVCDAVRAFGNGAS